MTTTLGERITNRLGVISKRKADLARACGVTPASVSDWVSGTSKNMSAENLLIAAEFLQCRPRWLLNGLGSANNEHTASIYEIRSPSTYYGDPRILESIKILEQMDSATKDDALGFLKLYSLKKESTNSSDLSPKILKNNQ